MSKFKSAVNRVALVALLVLPGAGVCADRLYDETGKYRGQVQDNGRIYNERGQYQGRIEKDRLYDDKGSYKGKVKASGVFSDRDDYTGISIRSEGHYDLHKRYFPDQYDEYDSEE